MATEHGNLLLGNTHSPAFETLVFYGYVGIKEDQNCCLRLTRPWKGPRVRALDQVPMSAPSPRLGNLVFQMVIGNPCLKSRLGPYLGNWLFSGFSLANRALRESSSDLCLLSWSRVLPVTLDW